MICSLCRNLFAEQYIVAEKTGIETFSGTFGSIAEAEEWIEEQKSRLNRPVGTFQIIRLEIPRSIIQTTLF